MSTIYLDKYIPMLFAKWIPTYFENNIHTFIHTPDHACIFAILIKFPFAFSENCRKCRYLDTMDCRLCGGRGHIQAHCPDTWRRFHATTTSSGSIVAPNIDVHLPPHQVWCCNCARQGNVHLIPFYFYTNNM